MKLKKIAAAAVAMAMAVSMMSVPVFADNNTTPSEDPSANGAAVSTENPSSTQGSGKASTEVVIKYSASSTQLSVTVPIKVTFAVKDSGDFITPSAEAYKITNNSMVPVYVDDISIDSIANGYSFVASDATGKQVQLSMQAGDSTSNTNGKVTLTDTTSNATQTITKSGWQLTAATKSGDDTTPATLNVKFDGKVGAVDNTLADTPVTLCKIVYTIKAGTAPSGN